jgi:hypothetical protein
MLVDEVVERLAALGEKVVQARLGALQEGVLVKCVLLSARAEHPPAEGFSGASCEARSRCEKNKEGENRRRVASGVRGVPVLVEKSSARWAAAR